MTRDEEAEDALSSAHEREKDRPTRTRPPVELGVNTEDRRPGEVSIGVSGTTSAFEWVSADEAREFGWRLIRAARVAEDLADEDRPRVGAGTCLAHLQPEPCAECASLIAAGL